MWDFFMEKILIYLIKNNKKHAVIFDNELSLLKLEELADINKDNVISNGVVKDSEKFKERWEIKTAKVKKLDKQRNSLKLTVEIDCKLLLRKL